MRNLYNTLIGNIDLNIFPESRAKFTDTQLNWNIFLSIILQKFQKSMNLHSFFRDHRHHVYAVGKQNVLTDCISDNVLDSYPRCSCFNSGLSRLIFFVIFLSPSKNWPGYCLD
jgi:hypothetical protein